MSGHDIETPCRCGAGNDVFIPHCPPPAIRKGSRTPPDLETLMHVAEVYGVTRQYGIEAVMRALSVSRSTAIRYIRRARQEDFIQ